MASPPASIEACTKGGAVSRPHQLATKTSNPLSEHIFFHFQKTILTLRRLGNHSLFSQTIEQNATGDAPMHREQAVWHKTNGLALIFNPSQSYFHIKKGCHPKRQQPKPNPQRQITNPEPNGQKPRNINYSRAIQHSLHQIPNPIRLALAQEWMSSKSR